MIHRGGIDPPCSEWDRDGGPGPRLAPGLAPREPLRRSSGLEIGEPSGETDVTLPHDTVRLWFFSGWPKDPYVSVPSVSCRDASILAPKKDSQLRRYVDDTEA